MTGQTAGQDSAWRFELGTSQARAANFPGPIPGTGKSAGAWCKFGVDDVESEMTQPAKVQEPSMEEILASIRRIIADDEAKPAEAKPAEAKPAAAEKPAPAPVKPDPPAAKPAAMKGIPQSAIAPKPAAPKPAPAPEPASASNNQDDIDAMLASLDAATPESDIRPAAQPEADVFELTDEMAVPEPAPAASAFHKIEPQDDLEFTEAARAESR